MSVAKAQREATPICSILSTTYCWWQKSCTAGMSEKHGINYQPLPDFFKQQYHNFLNKSNWCKTSGKPAYHSSGSSAPHSTDTLTNRCSCGDNQSNIAKQFVKVPVCIQCSQAENITNGISSESRRSFSPQQFSGFLLRMSIRNVSQPHQNPWPPVVQLYNTECWKELKNQYTVSVYRQKKHQPNSFISRDVGILKHSVWPLLFVLFSCFFLAPMMYSHIFTLNCFSRPCPVSWLWHEIPSWNLHPEAFSSFKRTWSAPVCLVVLVNSIIPGSKYWFWYVDTFCFFGRQIPAMVQKIPWYLGELISTFINLQC